MYFYRSFFHLSLASPNVSGKHSRLDSVYSKERVDLIQDFTRFQSQKIQCATQKRKRERECSQKRCRLQVPSNDLIDSLRDVFDIVIVQTSHRDPPVSSQINMSILYQFLALFSYTTSTRYISSHSQLRKRESRRVGERTNDWGP